jgi:hypothetical protein
MEQEEKINKDVLPATPAPIPAVTTQPERAIFRNDLYEAGNTYRRKVRKKGSYREYEFIITSFIIIPKLSIFNNGRETIIADFRSESGYVAQDIELQPDDWGSIRAFINRLPGKEFVFVGKDFDVQLIRHHLSKKDCTRKVGHETIGLHKFEGRWICLTNEGAIDSTGYVETILYTGTINDYASCLIKSVPLTGDELRAMVGPLSTFNQPHIVATILGWTTSAIFKPRLFELEKAFPILAVYGEPGSGKTETIRSVISGMYGLTQSEKSIGAMTPFTMMITANGSNCFPLCLDEFKPSKLSEAKLRNVSEFARVVYNSLRGDRGRPDLQKISLQYLAPTLIAGEDALIEPAVRERIIEIQFVKRLTQEYATSFEQLKRIRLTGLGRLILEKNLRLSDEDVKALYQEQERLVSPAFTGRYRRNVAMVRFGLAVLNQIFNEYAGVQLSVTAEQFEEGQRTTLTGDPDDQKSIADKIVEAILQMIYESGRNTRFEAKYYLEVRNHYRIEGTELRIHVPSTYPLFKRYAEDHGFEGDILTKKAFINQVRNEPYFISLENKQFLSGTTYVKKSLNLDFERLREKGIETHGLDTIFDLEALYLEMKLRREEEKRRIGSGPPIQEQLRTVTRN